MLRIRFLKQGKKNRPFFRIVVTERQNPPKGGRFLEIVGFFNPLTKEKEIKKERVEHWLSVGAQPSGRVHNLLIDEGIIKGKKVAVHSMRKKKKEAPKGEVRKEEQPKEVAKEEKQKEPEKKEEVKKVPPKKEEKSEEPGKNTPKEPGK